MIYLIVIVVIVALVGLLLALLFADAQPSPVAPTPPALPHTPPPAPLPQPHTAVPAQLTVPGTATAWPAAPWAQGSAPAAADDDDDFVPVGSPSAAGLLTLADIDEIEKDFVAVAPELADFDGGEVTDPNTDPDAICWVTGQAVAACQCDDCEEWRSRRGNR